MKKKRFLYLLLLLILSIVSAAALEGTVEFFDGETSIHRNGTTIPAEFGMRVDENDSVSTGEGAHAILSLPHSRTIKLGENTIVALESLDDETKVRLDKGSLFSKISRLLGSGFSVRTPTMTAGVRGTEFFIAYGRTIEERPDIWLCVNSGSVEVSVDSPQNQTLQKVIVKEGEGVQVLAGTRLTLPREYSWTKDLNWNLDPQEGDTENRADADSAYRDLLDVDYD